MANAPKPGASGWTIDKVILAPGSAVAALDELETLRLQQNKRINDLLNANNRYLNEARAARAELRSLRASMKVRH